MKAPLTKWFLSAMVMAVILALAMPSASCGFSNRLVQLADDPNDPNEPQPEFAPFESGRIYLEGEPNEPAPEFSPAFNSPVLLETEPNAPQPESHRC